MNIVEGVVAIIGAVTALVTAIGGVRRYRRWRSTRPPPRRPRQARNAPVSLEPEPYRDDETPRGGKRSPGPGSRQSE